MVSVDYSSFSKRFAIRLEIDVIVFDIHQSMQVQRMYFDVSVSIETDAREVRYFSVVSMCDEYDAYSFS